jgi:hypothetical protein
VSASAIERVTGWLVAGRFFPEDEEEAARMEAQRIELTTYCEAKFGRNGKAIAKAVWSRYELTPRSVPLSDKEGAS